MNLNFDMVKEIYDLLDDKKAKDIVVLRVTRVTTVADYFIIATGTSSTHINALCNHVEKKLYEKHMMPKHKEGRDRGEWVLMDYQDMVIHIFNAETRAYYGLERIWSDAEVVSFT